MSEAEQTGISEGVEPLRALEPRVIWYWRLKLLAETAAVWVAVLFRDIAERASIPVRGPAGRGCAVPS